MLKVESAQLDKYYQQWRSAVMIISKRNEKVGLNQNLTAGPTSLSSGTGSFSLLGVVPILGAVGAAAYKSTSEPSALPRLKSTDEVFDQLKSFSLTHLPKLRGVIPLRTEEVILGTRSVLLKYLFKNMNDYNKKHL